MRRAEQAERKSLTRCAASVPPSLRPVHSVLCAPPHAHVHVHGAAEIPSPFAHYAASGEEVNWRRPRGMARRMGTWGGERERGSRRETVERRNDRANETIERWSERQEKSNNWSERVLRVDDARQAGTASAHSPKLKYSLV